MDSIVYMSKNCISSYSNQPLNYGGGLVLPVSNILRDHANLDALGAAQLC